MPTERERTTLAPCPFCGQSEGLRIYGNDIGSGAMVECVEPCNALGPDGATRAEAAERWNTRPAPAQVDVRAAAVAVDKALVGCDWLPECAMTAEGVEQLRHRLLVTETVIATELQRQIKESV